MKRVLLFETDEGEDDDIFSLEGRIFSLSMITRIEENTNTVFRGTLIIC